MLVVISIKIDVGGEDQEEWLTVVSLLIAIVEAMLNVRQSADPNIYSSLSLKSKSNVKNHCTASRPASR